LPILLSAHDFTHLDILTFYHHLSIHPLIFKWPCPPMLPSSCSYSPSSTCLSVTHPSIHLSSHVPVFILTSCFYLSMCMLGTPKTDSARGAAKKTKKGKIKILLKYISPKKANLNKTSVYLHIYSSTCLSNYHLDIHLR